MRLILRVANFTTEVWRNPKLGIAYLRRGGNRENHGLSDIARVGFCLRRHHCRVKGADDTFHHSHPCANSRNSYLL